MTVSRVRPWIPVSVFALSFVYLLLAIFQPLNLFDEGLELVAAERILHGAVPYRDFAAYYSPGQFYTLATIFHFFGSSVLVGRIWDTLVRFGVCVLVFLAARALVPGRAAYLPFFIMLLFLGWCGFYGYPVIPAMFCALVGVLLLLRNWPANRPRLLFLAGIAGGLSVFYRQDVGVYALASGGIALLVCAPEWPTSSRPLLPKMAERLRALPWYGLGACTIILPALAYFLHVVPIGDLWAGFVQLPRLQLEFRRLALPPMIPSSSDLLAGIALRGVWFLLYTPLAVCLIGAAALLRTVRNSPAEPELRKEQFGRTLLVVFGLMLLVTTITRADVPHCLVPTIPASILFASLLTESTRSRRRAWSTLLVALCLGVLILPYGMAPIAGWAGNLVAYGPWKPASILPRARHFHVGRDEEKAIRFVQEHVPEGQPIFVGNVQHRRVLGNNVLFYFLADRCPGTRYDDFEPGVVTTASVQREMVRELKANRVSYVVLYSGFEIGIRKNARAEGGATVLDDFLRGEYREVRTFGRYTIFQMQRTSTGPASPESRHLVAQVPDRPPDCLVRALEYSVIISSSRPSMEPSKERGGVWEAIGSGNQALTVARAW